MIKCGYVYVFKGKIHQCQEEFKTLDTDYKEDLKKDKLGKLA
jgi:hypothetical protein